MTHEPNSSTATPPKGAHDDVPYPISPELPSACWPGDAISDGLLVLDPELRIVLVNRAFCEWSGFAKSELLAGVPPYPFWTVADAQVGKRRIWAAAKHDFTRFELPVSRRDGRDRDARLAVVRASGPAGLIVGYVATCMRASRSFLAAPWPPQELFEQARSLSGLSALALAVEVRDTATRWHAERVAFVASHLAAHHGWDGERCQRVRAAGLMHDVGKIGVPDTVLKKHGKLTAEEYEQMKTHTLFGAQISQELLDEEQVCWVRSHHERLDGGGYPDGLAGDEIPFGAKLLAVADTFDAITSVRRYGAKRSVSDALREVRRCSGTQFDPLALTALERWLRSGAH